MSYSASQTTSRFLTTPPTFPSPYLHRRPHYPTTLNRPFSLNPLKLHKIHKTSILAANLENGHDHLRFDAFLDVAEILCIGSPAVYSVGCLSGFRGFRIGGRVFVVQCLLLVVAVAIGGVIRRRQWNRMVMVRGRGGEGGLDLIARIAKVEEDARRSGTVVRVLSRQLEKLGIRFRLFRKGLKEPIAEAAALSQKNSEATRALAMQEDILEKELGEIQKVLLAMQEQQQKQLELILAIGKAGKLFDTKPDNVTEQTKNRIGDSTPKISAMKPLETQTGRRTGANDKV